MASGKRWTRNELLVAMNVYHKLTFGQLDQRQPVVAAVAAKLGRTPGSLALKLANLASLDPVLKLRGIRGMEGSSKLDREVWDEYHQQPSEAVPESEKMLRDLWGASESEEIEVLPGIGIKTFHVRPERETEGVGQAKIRLGQGYFRNAVLNNFGGQCGVTGLPVRELLIASHIVPWAADTKERLNVRNGIALSRLHDAAFDKGLIGFDDEYRMILSPRLSELPVTRSITEAFTNYEGSSLLLPEDAIFPEPSFLARHRKQIFKSA